MPTRPTSLQAVRVLATVALLALVPSLPTAADWPQWRGPSRDGQAPGFAAPGRWPAELSLEWRIAVGPGHSGPLVADDRIYLFVRSEPGEAVEARRLADGSLVWRQEYPTSYQVTPEARWHHRGPFSTPLLHDGILYTFGIAEVLSAWRAQDGELLWRRDFGDEFSTPWAYYGTSLSPILAAGRVVVHAGGPGNGALVGLEPSTGMEIWRWAGDGPPYGSAIVTEIGGATQLVSFSQQHLLGVDPVDGTLLWKLPYEVGYDNTVQTPLIAAGLVVMAAWDIPVRGYRVSRTAEGWHAEAVWENREGAVGYTSPVLVDGSVWGFSHRDGGRLYRLDPAGGEITWQGEPRAGEHATLVAAGNDLLVFAEDGHLAVLDAAAEVPSTLARYRLSETAIWAHPALAGSRILVKGQAELSLWRLPSLPARPTAAR
jgi:outer membrane protein assembly factor BamB